MKFDPKDMSTEQHERFGKAFLEVYLKHGFGVLGKRDIDCLIFACLHTLTDEDSDLSNYSWAKSLKITPTKIKNLKLESYLKYNEDIIQTDIDASLVRYLSNVEGINVKAAGSDISLSDIQIILVAEDPVLKMGIDQCAKLLSRHIEHGNNNENLYVDSVTFMLLVNNFANLEDEEAIRAIASHGAVQKAEVQKIQKEIEGASWSALSEGGKAIKFIELLGNTFAKKPMKLIEQLKNIATSQKYQA